MSESPVAQESGAAAPSSRHHLLKTLVALLWMYGGRGIGLLWTLALISRLGIGEYGVYSMGYAVMSIVAPTLNNAYAIRSVRESEDCFVAERASRYLLGLAVIASGQAFITVNYIVWFGLTVAGGELVMRSYLARAIREGHPDRSWRMDSIRGVASAVLGGAYLYSAAHPSLFVTSLLYCAPYLVVVVATAFIVRGDRPRCPGSPKLIAALSGEMLGTALYLQGDVLLLGWLTNSDIVGYYSITWVLASAIANIGQSYGGTYAAPLREQYGALSAGPPLRTTVMIGLGCGTVVLITGLVMLFTPAATQLAVAMIVMSGYCTMRMIILVFQQILYAQRRDLLRFTAAIGLVPFKFALVALLAWLAGWGAVGAATATTVTDAVLLIIFSVALYRKRPSSD